MLSRLASITLLFAAGLSAGPIIYVAGLNAASENPPTVSPGTGDAIVTIDTVANTLRVQLTFQGLTSGNTAAHIHCCIAPPNNTGVATTVPTFPGFPTGVTSGAYDSGNLDLTLASSYNPAFVTLQGSIANAEAALAAGLAAGNAYLNIHTTTFPGGEIRGFLVAVPEPATYALAIAGFGMLWVLKRKRAAK